MHGHIVLRRSRPPISVRVGIGSLVVLAAAAVGVVALLAVGVGSGDFPLSPGEVLVALFGGGDETNRFVVWTLRLPRLLTAVLIGASLAISGAIFQALARNPLVAPDIIGINGGAAVAAVGVIVLGAPGGLIGPAAFAGAFGAALLVYLLAWRDGIGPYRLVLVGIGVAAATTAGVTLLITGSEILEVKEATVWLIGSLYATGWEDVALVALALAILLPASIVLGRRLSLLQLGDEAAAGLGLQPERLPSRSRPSASPSPGRSASSHSSRRTWPDAWPAPPAAASCRPRPRSAGCSSSVRTSSPAGSSIHPSCRWGS